MALHDELKEFATMMAPQDAMRPVIERAADSLFNLRTALAFAANVIKSGEPWSPECQEIIGGALGSESPMGCASGYTPGPNPVAPEGGDNGAVPSEPSI